MTTLRYNWGFQETKMQGLESAQVRSFRVSVIVYGGVKHNMPYRSLSSKPCGPFALKAVTSKSDAGGYPL